MKEIKNTEEIVFDFVSTQENSADIANRGTTIDHLNNCHLWWNGPIWLQQPHKKWVTFKKMECDPESKRGFTLTKIIEQIGSVNEKIVTGC